MTNKLLGHIRTTHLVHVLVDKGQVLLQVPQGALARAHAVCEPLHVAQPWSRVCFWGVRVSVRGEGAEEGAEEQGCIPPGIRPQLPVNPFRGKAPFGRTVCCTGGVRVSVRREGAEEVKRKARIHP